MRTDRDRYIQIACRAAVCAGIALTALLNGLAVVDAGRDIDLELAASCERGPDRRTSDTAS